MFEKIKHAHKKNKYLLIKKAIILESFKLDFDFDMMFSLFSKYNNLEHSRKKEFLGQIIRMNNIPIFKPFLDYMMSNLKDVFKMGQLDFFYSLRGDVGIAHEDGENVIIIGIKNVTYYHVDNIDLQVNPGDLLFIPKKMLHHSFSSRERIILSFSVWNK